MIPDILSLQDPIMFHQPVNSYMECINARDAGRLMVSCLDQPGDSPFWGGYYNISGGPGCRTINYELLNRIYTMIGLRMERVMDRNWFALKNFHMMFYEDAERLNGYLNHWEGGLSMEDFYMLVKENLPWYLKMTGWLCRHMKAFGWLIEGVTTEEAEEAGAGA